MKLLVEMTDVEFNRYQNFKEGNYIPLDTNIMDILKLKGYQNTLNEINKDIMSNKEFAIAKYKKDKTIIMIKALE